MNFVAELKRRNVFKVAAAYAAVAWMFLELSALALNAFSAPAWVMKVVIFFAVAGFAVAVLLAWAFELTPEGIKRTSDTEGSTAMPSARSGKLMPITVTALALALVLVVVDSYVLDAPAAESAENAAQVAESQALASTEAASTDTQTDAVAQIEEKSLAILPFENLSSDPEQEYFSDGLSEELINTLAEVDGLLVTGRTSSFFFKDSELPLPEIGEMLGVANILQGSVRKSGDELRIAVQLTAVDSGFALWTGTFDRELDDIFIVQEEIATAVARALSVTLGAGAFAVPGMTRNVEAYDAYMQARAAGETYNGNSLFDAIVHIENAVRIDPDFALAWIYRGWAYRNARIMHPPEQTGGFDAIADESTAKALALAPEMRVFADQRAAQLINSNDFFGVDQLLQQDVERYGLDAAATGRRSMQALQTGRIREAVVFAQRARRQDPYSDVASGRLASALAANGQFNEAREENLRGLEMATTENESNFYYRLSTIEMHAQDWPAALEATSHLTATRDLQILVVNGLAAGDTAAALEQLRQVFVDRSSAPPVLVGQMPMYAAMLGEPELALEIMDATGMNGNIGAILTLSFFDDMRRLPGFKTLMEKEGLLNYWRTTGTWADYCRPVNDDVECF